VTAVTTAGLLAGLFGSAFVPTAVGATTAKAAYTEIYKGADVTGPAVIGNGGTIGFYANDLDGAGGFAASTQDAVNATYVEVAFFETSFRCNDGGTDDANGDCVDGVRYGDDEFNPTAGVKTLKATSSNSDIVVAWAMDEAGLEWGDDTDAVTAGTQALVCSDIQNTVSARGVVTSGQYAASDTIADPAGLTHHDTVTRQFIDVDGVARDQTDGTDATGVETWVLCLAAADDEVAATSTISLTVNGVAAGSFIVKAMNAPTSLTASLVTGYSGKIAGDNEAVTDYFVVQAKDANGTVLNGKSSTISSLDLGLLGTEGEDSDKNADDTEIDAFGAEGTFEYTFGLSASACSTDEGADDTGESYKVSFTLDNVNGDADADISSNDLTITCGQSADDARVTKVTPEATTGGALYEEAGFAAGDDDGVLMLVATVVSANGSAMGDGSGLVCGDFDWDVEFTDDAFLTETAVVDAVADDADAFMADDVIGGACDLGYFTPGAKNGDDHLAEAADDGLTRLGLYTYVVTANESDLANSGTDKDFALAYRATGTVDSVTIARVRNAAKTVATITFDGGEGAAFEPVYFQVEKANGTVVELRRRANGDGVARLVLARRNTTVYVYAYAGVAGDESDTIKVRFR
jgi:hypothetical protein